MLPYKHTSEQLYLLYTPIALGKHFWGKTNLLIGAMNYNVDELISKLEMK